MRLLNVKSHLGKAEVECMEVGFALIMFFGGIADVRTEMNQRLSDMTGEISKLNPAC